MEFSTDAQRAIFERILPMLEEVFGDCATLRDDVPGVSVMVGSALAEVGVHPWGSHEAVVNTRAYVVTGAEITPELTHFLLRKNNETLFGAFGLDSDDDIFFEHTIVGSTCDKEELHASVLAVVETADDLDEEIMARWGGQRARDTLG